MKPVISIGAQDFTYIRKNHCFYVDKTSFIKEWWKNRDAVTFITRPRRFGKTLNLRMVENFLSDLPFKEKMFSLVKYKNSGNQNCGRTNYCPAAEPYSLIFSLFLLISAHPLNLTSSFHLPG